MFNRPQSPKDVWRLTLVGSLCSVIVTVVLAPFAFVLTDPLISLIKAALIASLCAIPTCWVLFNEMSRNETLTIKLRELVNRDRLTGVATRDYLFTRMEAAPSSFGVSLKDRITDITKSIQEADDALYAAKEGGRNQTVFARARPKQAGLSSV